jgi:ribonuclease VapC
VILDASALVAVLRDEPERGDLNRIADEASAVRVSAATLLETSIVLTTDLHGELDDYLSGAAVEVLPFDAEQARIARQAYALFGKGSGSPARLNFGDCFSYALAKVTGEPLLFKGVDFTHTDVEPAYQPGKK